MSDSRFGMALLFPALAVLIIVGYAGGLGVAFILIDSASGEWVVAALGMALVVGVPTVAALVQRKIERE